MGIVYEVDNMEKETSTVLENEKNYKINVQNHMEMKKNGIKDNDIEVFHKDFKIEEKNNMIFQVVNIS